jgi:hypothetical protein
MGGLVVAKLVEAGNHAQSCIFSDVNGLIKRRLAVVVYILNTGDLGVVRRFADLRQKRHGLASVAVN